MPKVSAVLPDELTSELARRATVADRSLSAEIRRALAAYVRADCALGGWRFEEDWRGVWAVRDKPNHPGTQEYVLVEGWEGSYVERPLASMQVRVPGDE